MALASKRNGLHYWFFQQVSALYLLCYLIFISIYFGQKSNITFEVWQQLWKGPLLRYSGLIALISLLIHAWVGMWTIITDYVKPTAIRLFLHVSILMSLYVYGFWGVTTLWSIL